MENDLNIQRIKLTSGFFAIMTVILSVFSTYYWIENIIVLALGHFFMAIINVLYFVLTVKKMFKYSLITGLYLVYIILVISFIMLNALILGQQDSQFASLWLLIPIATIALVNSKMAFCISIVSALFQLILMLLWRIFDSNVYIYVMNSNQIYIINLFTVLAVIVLCIYSFFSAWRMDSMRETSGENNIQAEKKMKEFEKYQKIYNQLITCFEEEKLYKNPELTLSEVAECLNTNVTYIQRAMKHCRQDINFNNFVNQYRIAAIKKAIDQKEYGKYTIGYLYQMAGFKYQSTFNKVFKQFEGMTPSEYISLHKSKHKKESNGSRF